jgi:hypothetical protein
MVVGKVFHAAIEKVLAQGYSPDEAVFFAIAEANGLPQGERDYFIMSMVKRAYQRFKDVQNDYLDISSELHLVVETEAGLIQLFLDVVIDNPMVDELMIWDFKTSWHPFSAEDSKQLALYAYLFKTMRNGMVPTNYHGKLIFPRLKEDSDTHVVFTEEKLESARLWAVEAIWEIEKRDPDNIQDWEMTGDQKKCEFCPYVSLCAGGLFHGLPGDGTPKDADEAALIGQFILTQEMALKRMKEGIKKFSKKTGQPIVLNGGKWDWTKGEPSPKIPFDVIKTFAESHGLDLGQVMTTDTKVLKKWVDGDESGILAAHTTYSSPRSSFKWVEDAKETTLSEDSGSSTDI